MGLLDTIGEALDNPWSSAGVTPEQISANPWARRGMALSALGSQIIPAWEQGHKGFYGQIGAMGNAAQERAWEAQKRAFAVQQAQAALAMQAQRVRIASGLDGPQTPPQQAQEPQQSMPEWDTGVGGFFGSRAAGGSPAPAAPSQAPLSALQGVLQQQQGAAYDRKANADKYRRAAHELMKIGDTATAQKYIDVAKDLDPQEEWHAGADTGKGLVQTSKFGSAPRVLGIPGKAPDLPSEVRAVEYATGDSLAGSGDKGLKLLEWYRRQTAPGGVTVKMPAGETEYEKGIGKLLAEREAGILTRADSASEVVSAAHQVRKALDSGNIITGFGANTLVDLAKVGQFLGVGGKTAEEAIANTTTAMQGMAKAELAMAQENKGQGSWTENERKILERAALGKIDNTPASIKALALALEKGARDRVKKGQQVKESLARRPGTAGLAATFNFAEPPAYEPPPKAPAPLDPDEWGKLMPSVRGR